MERGQYILDMFYPNSRELRSAAWAYCCARILIGGYENAQPAKRGSAGTYTGPAAGGFSFLIYRLLSAGLSIPVISRWPRLAARAANCGAGMPSLGTSYTFFLQIISSRLTEHLQQPKTGWLHMPHTLHSGFKHEGTSNMRHLHSEKKSEVVAGIG